MSVLYVPYAVWESSVNCTNACFYTHLWNQINSKNHSDLAPLTLVCELKSQHSTRCFRFSLTTNAIH